MSRGKGSIYLISLRSEKRGCLKRPDLCQPEHLTNESWAVRRKVEANTGAFRLRYR
ncbi:hypothetical protein [Algoriphagus alkaliphilus]|uniref:hypothetical protein n=1 Tax=Algoriphagus alkaliphilus TaxID=279824 RepID=UPI0015872DF5|nr:hypothetical protein [Algoriphagus alkaliphilus]